MEACTDKTQKQNQQKQAHVKVTVKYVTAFQKCHNTLLPYMSILESNVCVCGCVCYFGGASIAVTHLWNKNNEFLSE